MSFSIDRERIHIQCPRCNFYSRPFLRQVRHQDVLICGGCKANIWLVDYIGQYRKKAQTHRTLGNVWRRAAAALSADAARVVVDCI